MPRTILVVDDEEIARRFLERALTHEGYNVLLANDGEEALELLRTTKRKVVLVITDLVMPGMGGHAFAVEVARLPSPPPVLYISAYESPQGEMATRFLQKPFSPEELAEAVKHLLSAKKPAHKEQGP
jgi:two-component system, cell cycle sensor histidine kinase and response regulator CckA